MNIPEFWLKIKNLIEDVMSEWGILIIVILVGIASFGLGRLSAIEEAKSPVSITAAQVSAVAPAVAVGGLVVAPRKGSVYHYPWCSGANSIAEANKIWFKDEKAARAAGYMPAKNCKGLK